MKLLHTSDWHLGRNLYSMARYDECEQWLQWLVATLQQQCIDILVIAGDIFDTTTPTHKAQQQYYNFLLAASRTYCQHIVVIGGNHDSPTFLNAPKSLLHTLNVHVVGAAEPSHNQVLTLFSQNNKPLAIVCAIPYLRDSDLRSYNEHPEAPEDKSQALVRAIAQHYQLAAQHAQGLQAQYHTQHADYVPIIATGHLFAAGGSSVEGDGMRDLYVGNLAHITAEVFPECLDYVALGHLHSCQKVGGHAHIRYSGSPMAMSFAEATKPKYGLVVEWKHAQRSITALEIPCFQALQVIQGDWTTITLQITALIANHSNTWLEIAYTGTEVIADLRQQLQAMIANTPIQILRIKGGAIHRISGLHAANQNKPLNQWSETEVFEQRLLAEQPCLNEAQKNLLRPLYHQILTQIKERDAQAE